MSASTSQRHSHHSQVVPCGCSVFAEMQKKNKLTSPLPVVERNKRSSLFRSGRGACCRSMQFLGSLREISHISHSLVHPLHSTVSNKPFNETNSCQKMLIS